MFIDQKEGHLSHTKFWSNVGYVALIWAFVYAQLTGKPLPTDLYFFMGTVLMGNRTILKGIDVIKNNKAAKEG